MQSFDIDRAKAETSLEDAAGRCGISLEVHGTPPNVRIDCPFSCPGDHQGKCELSVNVNNPDKVFRCHNYECQFRGNLIHLMHGWLTGQKPADGKVKGDDFKRVKTALAGEPGEKLRSPKRSTLADPTTAEDSNPVPTPTRNVPLAESDQPTIRAIIGLEELLTTDVEKMSTKASAYWRGRRGFLSDEICAEWGVGVRPSRAGTDKRGWSLRNQIVYRFLSEDNQVLAYVGRDPEFEQELAAYESLLPDRRDPRKRPIKHRFPTGFHRGLELFGQHKNRLTRHPEYREFIWQYGIIIVEGFNDVLALDHQGVPAVGICSNRMTEQQATKLARWARQIGNGKISVMFDCEDSGDEGAKEALWYFAQHAPDIDVRLAWSRAMHGGKFAGSQPESVGATDLCEILLPALRR